MCLIRCNVRINGTPSGSGVHRGPGDHHGTSRPTKGRRRIRRTEGGVRTNTESTNKGAVILTADPGSTDGVRAPTTDHWSTAADHRSANEAVPAPAVRLYQAWATDTNSDEQTGRSTNETCGTVTGVYTLSNSTMYPPILRKYLDSQPSILFLMMSRQRILQNSKCRNYLPQLLAVCALV